MIRYSLRIVFFAHLGVEKDFIFAGSPRRLLDRRIEVIAPPLPALLSQPPGEKRGHIAPLHLLLGGARVEGGVIHNTCVVREKQLGLTSNGNKNMALYAKDVHPTRCVFGVLYLSLSNKL